MKKKPATKKPATKKPAKKKKVAEKLPGTAKQRGLRTGQLSSGGLSTNAVQGSGGLKGGGLSTNAVQGSGGLKTGGLKTGQLSSGAFEDEKGRRWELAPRGVNATQGSEEGGDPMLAPGRVLVDKNGQRWRIVGS